MLVHLHVSHTCHMTLYANRPGFTAKLQLQANPQTCPPDSAGAEWCGQMAMGLSGTSQPQYNPLYRTLTETVHALVEGSKLFTLFPPQISSDPQGLRSRYKGWNISSLLNQTDIYCIHHHHPSYPSALSSQEQQIQDLNVEERFPPFANAGNDGGEIQPFEPIYCVLHPGQYLYVPVCHIHLQIIPVSLVVILL